MHTSEGGRDDRGVPYHAESTYLSSAQVCATGVAIGRPRSATNPLFGDMDTNASATARAKGAVERFGILPGYPQYMLGTCLSSILCIMAACIDTFKTDKVKYGIAVGSIGLAGGVLGVVLDRDFQVSKKESKVGEISARELLAGFLALWFGVAVIVLTFSWGSAYFAIVGNGYFSLWLGFGLSLAGLMESNTAVREKVHARVTAAKAAASNESDMASQAGLVAVASVVVFMSCFPVTHWGREWPAIIALVISSLSFIIAIVLAFGKNLEQQLPLVRALAIYLLAPSPWQRRLCAGRSPSPRPPWPPQVSWIATTICYTFYRPGVGNGYFGCFAAIFFSFKLFAIFFLKESPGPAVVVHEGKPDAVHVEAEAVVVQEATA